MPVTGKAKKPLSTRSTQPLVDEQTPGALAEPSDTIVVIDRTQEELVLSQISPDTYAAAYTFDPDDNPAPHAESVADPSSVEGDSDTSLDGLEESLGLDYSEDQLPTSPTMDEVQAYTLLESRIQAMSELAPQMAPELQQEFRDALRHSKEMAIQRPGTPEAESATTVAEVAWEHLVDTLQSAVDQHPEVLADELVQGVSASDIDLIRTALRSMPEVQTDDSSGLIFSSRSTIPDYALNLDDPTVEIRRSWPTSDPSRVVVVYEDPQSLWHSEASRTQTEAYLSSLFHRPIHEAEIGRFIGAHPGDVVHVNPYGMHGDVGACLFFFSSSERTVSLTVTRPQGGGIQISGLSVSNSANHNITSGREIVRTLLTWQDYGVSSVVATAAGHSGDKTRTGYKEWARLGFTGDIPSECLAGAQARFGSNVTRVEQLMVLRGGYAWWAEHGSTWTASLELTPGSNASNILERLRAHHEAQP